MWHLILSVANAVGYFPPRVSYSRSFSKGSSTTCCSTNMARISKKKQVRRDIMKQRLPQVIEKRIEATKKRKEARKEREESEKVNNNDRQRLPAPPSPTPPCTSPQASATAHPSSASPPPSTSSQSSSSTSSGLSSAKKRKILFEKVEQRDTGRNVEAVGPGGESDDSVCLFTKSQLISMASACLCSECYQPTLTVRVTGSAIDPDVALYCTTCRVNIYHKKKERIKIGEHNFCPQILRAVYSCMLRGQGYRSMEGMYSFLGIRPITHITYNNYKHHIVSTANEELARHFDEAVDVVFQYYKEELQRLPDDDGFLNIDVSFDGTWHIRGHNSSLGCGVIIEAHTRVALDRCVLSKTCSSCKTMHTKYARKKITESNYQSWIEKHKANCNINFEKSSGAMEAEEAVVMWKRSQDRKLRYTVFIGDGDSSAYISIINMNNKEGPYGKAHPVVKEECKNHVKKRMRTALVKLREGYVVMKKTKTGNPKRTKPFNQILCDDTIKHLEFYYGQAISRHEDGTTDAMKKDIMSTLLHLTSTDANPNHHWCSEVFCLWKQAMKKDTMKDGKRKRKSSPVRMPSHDEMRLRLTLNDDEYKELHSVYTRLSEDNLLSRCLKGKTQNPNESLHSRIWVLCPKVLSVSKAIVDFAVAQACLTYNKGYKEGNLCQALNIPTSTTMMNILKKWDESRERNIVSRPKRKRIRLADPHYAPGSF